MELKQKTVAFPSLVARFGIILLFAVYPLLMTNKYHNITATKYVFFCVISAVCLAACLIGAIVKSDFSNPESKISQLKEKTKAEDVTLFIFALVSVASCLSSDYFIAALGGGQGRYMGLMMNLSLVFAYLFITKFYVIKEKDFLFMGFAFIAVITLALIQFLGYDPFGMIATLTSVRKTTFLSTIGNMNVYASYITIVAPLAMYMFCFTDDKKKAIFPYIFSCFGFIGLFTSNSDSGYIGIGVAFVLTFILSTKTDKSFKKMWALVMSFFLIAGLFKILSIIYKDTIYCFTLLTKISTSTYVITGGFLISATVLYIMKQYNPTPKVLKTIRTLSVAAVILAINAAIMLFIYCTFINKEISLGGLENYLRFDELWGTGRGDIWTKAFKAFGELPLRKKLIGAGEDTFALLLTDKLGYSQIKIGNSYYDNAHSELIQHLLSIGIIGLGSYLTLAFFAIKSAIKSNNTMQKALLLPLSAFLVQSTVNILQPITSPFIFVLFALAMCKTKSE